MDERTRASAPLAIREIARTRVHYENGRFLAEACSRLTKAERDELDRWLVAIKHPLAYEPGSQEWRAQCIARELAN